ARLDAGRAKAVVVEQVSEALRESPASGEPELMSRRRQIVVPDDFDHAAEIPEGTLDAREHRLERLPEGQLHLAPAPEPQHQLEEEVLEEIARDRDFELGRVREVELRLPPRRVHLLEENLLRRTLRRSPVPNPALQSPELAGLEPARMILHQRVEDGL